jgi:hypothetical protein
VHDEGPREFARDQRSLRLQRAPRLDDNAGTCALRASARGVRTMPRPERTRIGSPRRARIRASAWLIAGVERPTQGGRSQDRVNPSVHSGRMAMTVPLEPLSATHSPIIPLVAICVASMRNAQ